MAKFAIFNCPKCDGKMFDNRDSKINPKAPDYKCANKECGNAIWPDKGEVLKDMHQDQQRINGQSKAPFAEPKVDWEAKDRQSIAQTAMNGACQLVSAMIPTMEAVPSGVVVIKEVKTIAKELFEEMNNLKAGGTIATE